MGYSSCHKGYKCLNSNGKIFMSKDVVFDEKTFLYATQVHSWIISLGIIPFFVDFPSQHATQESPFVNIPSESNPPNESNSLFRTTYHETRDVSVPPTVSNPLNLFLWFLVFLHLINLLILCKHVQSQVLSNHVVFLPYFSLFQNPTLSSKLWSLLLGTKQCKLNMML